MQPRSLKFFEDIRVSASFILRHTEGRTLDDYSSDPLLRAAVERHFIIIGEAVTRLRRDDDAALAMLDDYPQIVGFRNFLVHVYDMIDDAIVWGIVQSELPGLQDRVTRLIEEESPGA